MNGRWAWRIWSPAAAFVVLLSGWYFANVAAFSASLRTMRRADSIFVAAGHPAPFGNWSYPSVWDWTYQATLRSAGFGVVGAALLALVLRRASRTPLFVLAGALPVVVGHTGRIHDWWAAGPGIDQWTSGAGVGTQDLDLSHFGAGPSWTLAGGTVLAIAAVIVPALLVRPAAERAPRAWFVRALPYVALLVVAASTLTGALHVDTSGDGSSHEMLVAALASALFAGLAAFVVTERGFWRTTGVMAAAAGLVMVSGLNPAAMSNTKWAAFATAAAIAVLGAVAARRPGLCVPLRVVSGGGF